MICDPRYSLRFTEPGEDDIVGRGDSIGEVLLEVELRGMERPFEHSFVSSVDGVRFKFLNTFHDDFLDLIGLGGVLTSVDRVLLRVFKSAGSFGSLDSLGSLGGPLTSCERGRETDVSDSERTLERFCCRMYNSFRMVTAFNLASIAESMHDSKSVTLSSLLAKVRWCRNDACTSIVRACRARCAISRPCQRADSEGG